MGNSQQANNKSKNSTKKKSKKSEAALRKEAAETIQPSRETLQFYKENDSGILQTLCPPVAENKLFYEQKNPKTLYVNSWKKIVEIATEAVLYPQTFKERTRKLENVFFYTSGRNSFSVGGKPYQKFQGQVDGKKLSEDNCINLWVDGGSQKSQTEKTETSSEESKKKKKPSQNHRLKSEKQKKTSDKKSSLKKKK